MKRFITILKNQSPARLIALGFAAVILTGSLILMLPVSVREGATVTFIDALFTSTSAVCVTGLIAIDTADHFTAFGQGVVAVLIQIGGLGVTSVGVGLIIAAGKRVGLKGRLLVKEALNIDSYKGIVRLVKSILLLTLCFEATGAVLSFIVFSQDYPTAHALGISIFHSIAAFNNSGFDILGGLRNLIPYQDNVLLNMTTCFLIIFGGLGFLVILDIARNRRFRKLSLHSKVVIVTTAGLLATGTLLLKATEDITWMGAFFHSVSARTAGFSTYPIGTFTNAGLFVLCLLMFIGAWFDGRRYQDKYVFYAADADEKRMYRRSGTCFPQRYFKAEYCKSEHYNDSVRRRCVHCDVSDVRTGTGLQLYPASV